MEAGKNVPASRAGASVADWRKALDRSPWTVDNAEFHYVKLLLWLCIRRDVRISPRCVSISEAGAKAAELPLHATRAQCAAQGGAVARIGAAATHLKCLSLTNDAPAQVRADGDLLAEIESESDDHPGVVRSTTWFDSTSNPVSLVCHYGGVGPVTRSKAKLIIPLPARTKGECIVSNTQRAGKLGMPRVSCMRAR